MNSKRALISGISGQDGSYLAEFLLKKGYEVSGLIRRLSQPNTKNIQHLIDNDSINLIGGDLTDQSSILHAINISKPEEIYNLGAQSFVAESWNQPEITTNVNSLGALRVFDAVKQTNKNVKIYQASSSEMYGITDTPQDENTQMNPRSIYGASKLFAHKAAKVYRESYDMFISCGILFNHESERRGIEFVSRKITDAVARIKLGPSPRHLTLGNLTSKRDWGYAKDYVEAIYLMLQQDKPDDFVIATGENHSVEEFVDLAFKRVNLNWQDFTSSKPELFRPAEIFELKGDYSKAKRILNWKPTTNFNELVNIMVDADLERYKNK